MPNPLSSQSSQFRLRVSVLGLFVDAGDVLLIHQMDLPEPDCWDLPGGGLEPHETLMEGLRREIQEETGITEFQVDDLLTVIENFFPKGENQVLHTLSLIYKCSLSSRPTHLHSAEQEIGPKGIQWLASAALNPKECSGRAQKALEAAGLLKK